MSIEVLDQLFELIDNGQPLFIQLTGGEPTLVPDLIDMIGYKSQIMKKQPHLAIQTNGTLLTPALITLFKKFNIQVGLSIDGPPEIQEELRGSSDRSLRGMVMLEEAGQDFRVTSVISNKNVHDLDRLVLFLASFGSCRGIGLDLLIDKGRANSTSIFPAEAEHLRRGITRMVHTLDGLNKKRKNPILLREMELIKSNSSRHAFCQAASGQSLAVQSDGSLFPCGQTLGDPSFDRGSLSYSRVQLKSKLTNIKLQSDNCNTCRLLNRCPGECPSRIHYNGLTQSTLICELYRSLDALK